MQNERFSIKKRMKSFAYAFHGFSYLLRDEHNARIHLIAAILAIFLGFILDISNPEWIAIIIAIGFVFAMEMVNSAIEALCDFVSPEHREIIKKAKDVAAGAVLMAAMTAAMIGIIVFGPKLYTYIAG